MIIVLDIRDNVGVASENLAAGRKYPVAGASTGLYVNALTDIPGSHKIALRDIAKGEKIIKYGAPIGTASFDIPAGGFVHSHNLASALTDRRSEEYLFSGSDSGTGGSFKSTVVSEKFMGYPRSDGRGTGIRNEVWIIPTVGCINGTVRNLAKAAGEKFGSGTDGIFALVHPYGCSQLGDDLENTRRILRGLILHPNAGGVLVTGLGCENNRLSELKASLGTYDPLRIRFMECQAVEDEMQTGLGLIGELVEEASSDKRVPVPISELIIGLKCGGSDAFSGITANPLLGVLTDRLIGLGASAVMAEVPEMFGAEKFLMERSLDRKVFADMVGMIDFYNDHFLSHGVTLYENPSPGNKEGGITTLEEKSLGCIRKSGTSPIVDVVPYGEIVSKKGMNLLYSPGNDLVSSTALAAAGAQIILFTTGRGTPYGSPVPTVKIASNSKLAQTKHGWIDFDAGTLTSDGDYNSAAGSLMDLIRGIASGEIRTKNEINGHRDIAIFKSGVTL